VRKADNLPPSRAVVTKSGNLNLLETLGLSRPVMGLIYRPRLVEILLPFYGTFVPYSQQAPHPKLSPTPYILQDVHFANSFLGLI